MVELPERRRTCLYETDSIKCFQYDGKDLIELYMDNCGLDRNLIEILRQRIDVPIVLNYDGTLDNFNELLSELSQPLVFNPTEIRLNDNVKIPKNAVLKFKDLRENVKINIVSEAMKDSKELNSWCLNLSDDDFKNLYGKIAVREQARMLCEQRELAKQVYLFLSQTIDFSRMTATEKMDYMFNWVENGISYDVGLIQADGNYRDDVDRSLGYDPYKVFVRGKGVCSGRSRLLKILLNNPYMGVNCYTANGYSDKLEHEWNEFIDESGSVYAYDLSFGIKHEEDITKNEIDHHAVEHSHIVEAMLDNEQFAPPPLPQRRNTAVQKTRRKLIPSLLLKTH